MICCLYMWQRLNYLIHVWKIAPPLRTDRLETLCSVWFSSWKFFQLPFFRENPWHISAKVVGDLVESHIQCTIFPTSGRFGRWPEGKLWLCGGFKSVGSSVCCKHEHVQQGNRFHGDLKRSKRSPFFKARTSGPLTYDSWPCIFLRVLCIRI